MSKYMDFEPNWASPPGDTICDVLQEKGLTIENFGSLFGYNTEQVHLLLKGRVEISKEIAEQLEVTVGATANFWMRRDLQYREDLARLDEKNSIATAIDWLKSLPLQDMLEYNWIPKNNSIHEKVTACLRFFDVPDIPTWKERYGLAVEMAAFRTSQKISSHHSAVAAWLRQGEIQSESNICESWDPTKFIESLSNIRALTREKNPAVFIPELQRQCADCGVSVVIVRAPTGCRASGATRFISENKAILMLSFRHLSDDHFWFSFFHEAGHLILHNKEALFLEGLEPSKNQQEIEANNFAQNMLIPEGLKAELLELPLDGRVVMRFARKIGISPGIVVGQLQHLNKIKPFQLNNLKIRYMWPS
jgi:Zn-dependent peptidase ImmA (M78 family)/plasmid maintenance system antidote protein VapI